MRWFVRIVFGLDFVYQTFLGLLGLAAPTMLLDLYGASAADKDILLLRAIVRGLSFNLLFGAVISALIALDPDRQPVLPGLMGVLALLTLVAWTLTVATGEMVFAQVGIDMVVQVVILAAVAGYYSRAGRRPE